MLKKALVSLAATAMVLGSVSPAFAREGYTKVKMHKSMKTNTMTVRKGDKRVKVMRATRRDIKNMTRSRWNPPKAQSSSSSSATSSEAGSASSN